MRPTVYFQRIGLTNFPYAWLLSLGNRVVAWKIELPGFLARRFARFEAYDLFSRDEKLKLQEDCFDLWRQILLPQLAQHKRCTVMLNGKKIDFSKNLWQLYGVEFERLFLLVQAVQREHAASQQTTWRIVCAWPLSTLGHALLEQCFPGATPKRSTLNDCLDALHEWLLTVGHWYRGLRGFCAGFGGPRLPLARGKLFWLGISPQEVPDADHRLNCAWAAQYEHIAPAAALYFLPQRTNPAQRRYLERHGIAWVEPGGEYRLVSAGDGLHALWRALIESLRGLLIDAPGVGAYRARFAARSLIWAKVLRRCAPRAYLTTTSASWPERPELAVLKAYRVKSVIWAYSANSLRFASHYAGFRDVSVERSILIADEFWTWNEAFRDWLQKRQMSVGGDQIAVSTQGAMMCGDVGHLRLAPSEARRLLGLQQAGLMISVFDVPAVSRAWKLRFLGTTPTMELDYSEAFFAGIRAVLERFPEVTIALKLKRGLSEPSRAFPPALLELARADGRWLKQGRLVMLDTEIDPYLPIAIGDAAIGMAFTSPVLVALASGRGGIYYDPLQLAGCPSEPSYRAATVQNLEQLLSHVAGWIRGDKRTPDSALARVLPRLGLVDFSRLN